MSDDPNASEMNVYGGEARESLIEDGEISPEEEAFMQGYEESEHDEEEDSDEAYEAAFVKRKRRTSKKS